VAQHRAHLPLLISARSADWGTRTRTFPGRPYSLCSVVLSLDGRLVVSGLVDQTIRVWDVPTGTDRTVIRGHDSLVSSVGLSPDSQLIVTGSKDSIVHIWDVSTGVQQHAMNGHDGEVNVV
jgi:WD40 repeat protein